MADDWRPGDLALCVDGRRRPLPANQFMAPPVEGRIYTVSALFAARVSRLPSLQMQCGMRSYAERFRKINPLTDQERETALRELNAPARENV